MEDWCDITTPRPGLKMQQRVMGSLTLATSLVGLTLLGHVSQLRTVETETIAPHDGDHLVVGQILERLTCI